MVRIGIKYYLMSVSCILLMILVGCRNKDSISTMVSNSTSTSINNNISTEGFMSFDGDGFSFKYPASWVAPDKSKLPSMAQNAKAVFLSPTASKNSFHNNVNVTITESQGLVPSAKYWADQTENQFKIYGEQLGVSDYKKLGFMESDYGNFKAGILAGEYTLSQTGARITCIQYYIPQVNKAYTMTISIDKEEFDTKKFDDIIRTMQDSFVIK